MPSVTIPYCPRYPQRDIHDGLENARFSVIVAHRRMGKTVCVLNHMIKMALLLSRSDGRFAYVAPYRNQAKSIAWDYLKRFAGVLPNVRFNESELECSLPGGSRIRLYGADNPDAMRGLYFDGVVLDEVADMKPNVWGEIIRPALADRSGWAVFIGTPKGQNLFHELYLNAARDGWFRALYRADETNIMPAEELAAARETMSDAQYRQEFLCDFSAACDNILITIDLVSDAVGRGLDYRDVMGSPRVIGVDVARFGDDRSVVCKREGLICHDMMVVANADNMTFAGMISREIDEFNPDAVFVDAGRGEGVIDRLRQLGYSVVEVNFGSRAIEDKRYANKRSEMWDKVREWLAAGGQIPNDSRVKSELSAPTYSFDAAGRLVLERKEHIKERGLPSPDLADALALTFAAPVRSRNACGRTRVPGLEAYDPLNHGALASYDPFGGE